MLKFWVKIPDIYTLLSSFDSVILVNLFLSFSRKEPHVTVLNIRKKNIHYLFLEVGDLGRYLLEKNLVSHIKMRPSQSTIYNTNQPPPGFPGLSSAVQHIQKLTQQNENYNNSNGTLQQPPNRMIQKPMIQPLLSTL
jgi:hypothetical protein